MNLDHTRLEFGFDAHAWFPKAESEHCRICGISLFELLEKA